MQGILPSDRFKAVTKSDTAMQTYTCATVPNTNASPLVLNRFRYLYVGGGGDLVVKNDVGTAVAHKAVPTGSVLILSGTYIMNATTATDIVAYF